MSEEQSRTQKHRLAYIDFRLYFLGMFSRSDLIERFGIKEAAATRDITLYKELAPDNLIYDTKLKSYYYQNSFKPLFEYPPNQVLSLLAYGVGNDFLTKHNPLLMCETPTRLNAPNLDELSVLTRAIHQKKVVKMSYQSPNSGLSNREFIPSFLVNTGLRWHIRGYDRKRSQFADFVITRISTPSLLNMPPEAHEKSEHDIQWNRILELEVVPHPGVKHPKSIEKDYDMKDGVLKLNIRAAVAGYLLRLWNIDCSRDHRLRSSQMNPETGHEFQLWLRNWQCLYGIENATIAPGNAFNNFHE